MTTDEWGGGIELGNLKPGLMVKLHLKMKPLSPVSISVREMGTIVFHKYLQKSVKYRNDGNR